MRQTSNEEKVQKGLACLVCDLVNETGVDPCLGQYFNFFDDIVQTEEGGFAKRNEFNAFLITKSMKITTL